MSVVTTYNLFIDTSVGRDGGCTGIDYLINLQDAGVIAGAGQYIRLTLNSFSMNKVFPQVNSNNNKFKVKYFDARPVSGPVEILPATGDITIPMGTYDSNEALATAFGEELRKYLKTKLGNAATINATIVNRMMVVTIDMGDVNHYFEIKPDNPTSPDLPLLGGRNGIPFNIVRSTNTVSAIQSNDQMLRESVASMKNIYVRIPNVAQTGLETGSLSGFNLNKPTHALHGDILAEIPVNKVVFGDTIYYSAENDRAFFANIKQKSLEQIRLKLTDHRNQLIPSLYEQQSVSGNLSFTCNLRIDIIQERLIDELQSAKTTPSIPARFAGVLTHQGFGKNDFGAGPGF